MKNVTLKEAKIRRFIPLADGLLGLSVRHACTGDDGWFLGWSTDRGIPVALMMSGDGMVSVVPANDLMFEVENI